MAAALKIDMPAAAPRAASFVRLAKDHAANDNLPQPLLHSPPKTASRAKFRIVRNPVPEFWANPPTALGNSGLIPPEPRQRFGFLQTDPIGYGAGMNWYSYVDNDPLNRTDPTGLVGAAIKDDRIKNRASVPRSAGGDAMNGRGGAQKAGSSSGVDVKAVASVTSAVDKALSSNTAGAQANGVAASRALTAAGGAVGAVAAVATTASDVSNGMSSGQALVKNTTSVAVGTYSVPQGAAAGAAFGAPAGPWGAGAGAVVGAFGGAIFADTSGSLAGAAYSNAATASQLDNSSAAIAQRLAPLTCPMGCSPR